jgi:predicted nucleic acid-binding protein
MSVPTVIFIDTSVFDSQNYNYESSAISSFLDATTSKAITLVLPHPTEQEVLRHISVRAKEAIDALDAAKRRAPFLTKWKCWPVERKSLFPISWEVSSLAKDEWQAFLKHFQTVRLGYEGIRIEEIMQWYDRACPPFGKGKKQKEFPDALAVAIVLRYAKEHTTAVAVVSHDDDMAKACGLYSELLHFGSLPSYTEATLSSTANFSSAKETVLAAQDDIEDRFYEAACELNFCFDVDDCNVEDVHVSNIFHSELRLVALGDKECTVSFEAHVDFEVTYSLSSYELKINLEGAKASASSEVTGSAKIQFSDSWGSVTDISAVTLDQDDVEVTVTDDPWDEYWDG